MELTIMKLSVDRAVKAETLYGLLRSHEYTEERGLGFKELSIENESVSGLALKKTPIFINVFDPITGGIIEQEQFVVNEVDFRIDIPSGFIEIFAPVKSVRKLITVFFHTVNDKIGLEQLQIIPSDILKGIKSKFDFCEILKLHIKDFSSEKGVIGSYDVKAIDSEIGWRFVDQYRTGIVKVTVAFGKDGFDAFVQIFQDGKFKIVTKPRNRIESVLSELKELI